MSVRQEKLADQIRDLVAMSFHGGRIDDPRLSGVTITSAKITPDLGLVYIYFRIFDPSQLTTTQKALEGTKGRLKGMIGKNLKLRRVPNLKFFYDESIEYGSHIESLIDQVKKEK